MAKHKIMKEDSKEDKCHFTVEANNRFDFQFHGLQITYFKISTKKKKILQEIESVSQRWMRYILRLATLRSQATNVK